MDWRSNLKRAQSLSLSSAGDQASWTETQQEAEGAISVSRLVARSANKDKEIKHLRPSSHCTGND